MRLRTLFVVTVLALGTLNALAADTYWTERFRYDRESPTLFNPNEFTLDLFGTYADRNRFGVSSDNWGGGLGFNYFVTRYIGLSVDSYIEEWKWPYRVNGNVILRLPIDQANLAPYVFGGGGRQYKYVPQWNWQVGGGLEIRVNAHTGFFADGRAVFPEDTGDYALVRFGMRLGF